MSTRKIVRVDEDLCDGCGECITACSEGALRLVNGKAKLVTDAFCDGFGDCIGECPTGALTIEEREAEVFDLGAARAHVAREGGAEAVRRLEAAAARHDEKHAAPAALHVAAHAGGGGCPGSRMQYRPPQAGARPAGADGPAQVVPSELRQWPVQLHLVQPAAPFFKDRELLILNTCGAVASADAHWRFLRGRAVVVACPKLDDTTPYASKLAAIFRESATPKATVVRMEVPCCGGLTALARKARTMSGCRDLVLEEVTLSVSGDVLGAREVR